MAREDQIVIEGPIVVNLEIRVPLRSGEDQNVAGIHLADSLGRPDHQRLEFGVQLLLVLEIVGDRFVHQVVAEDRGFVRITAAMPRQTAMKRSCISGLRNSHG